ncbi:hypothetical protein CYMTET_51982 [Cymbomonas tetramitiformis]|uniref:Uncharacterized protein n=1 Tax=Cymbomonas tetramitiformis TaxID=36881 RepID=A0AAE0BJW2_9CHLO|nr:hypothetical protein CYMTET_51982 [Cymbomonas tetramitiformis]
MDSSESVKIFSYLGKLPKYTGTKNENRPNFVQDFVLLCETIRRQHDASIRSKSRSVAGAQMTDAHETLLRNTQPDWQMVWDTIPSLLAGEGNQTVASPAYSWWCASYEEGGLVASKMDQVLKDTRNHGPLVGSVPCARPPFNEREQGSVWRVAKVFEDGDSGGEVSLEYSTSGTSLRGPTGGDCTIDTQHYWALRALIAELESKFMMKGTQEKFDLLTSKSQEPGQDGLTYVKMCQRREMQLHAGTAVSDDTLRQFIEDCVNHLRITIFKTRVSEQLRVQFPPPSKVTWNDLEGIVEVQDKLKNDAESWILAFLQELTRRSGCKYSCWEAGSQASLPDKSGSTLSCTPPKTCPRVQPSDPGLLADTRMTALPWLAAHWQPPRQLPSCCWGQHRASHTHG